MNQRLLPILYGLFLLPLGIYAGSVGINLGQESFQSSQDENQSSDNQPQAAKDEGIKEESHARVTKVTISDHFAIVVRELVIPPQTDRKEYHFGTLPAHVIPDSIHATATDGLKIESLLRIENDVSDQAKTMDELQAKIDLKHKEKGELESRISVIDRQLTFLERAMDFSRLQGASDLQKGTLDTSALTSMIDFGINKQSTLSQDRQALAQQLKQTVAGIEELERNIAEHRRSNIQFYDVVAVVRNESKLPGRIQLQYFVTGCHWKPTYQLRYHSMDRRFDLRMIAQITQSSGEDWTNVRLEFSNDRQLRLQDSHVLVPFQVRLKRLQHATTRNVDSVDIDLDGDSNRNESSLFTRQSNDQGMDEEICDAWKDQAFAMTSVEANHRALLMQEAELSETFQRAPLLADDRNVELGFFSLQLGNVVTIPDRSINQSIEIQQASLDGSIVHVATPLLSSFAYRGAFFEKGTGFVLPAGSVFVYEDDQYIGQTAIRSVQSRQPFSISMGPDAKVRTRRELLKKAKESQGGNAMENHSIKIVVANYHAHPVMLRLQDRIPLPVNRQEAMVEYSASNPALSEDPHYIKSLFPRNILRWDLEIPPESFGNNSFDHNYSYSLVYDKSFELQIAFEEVKSGLAELSEMVDELELINGRDNIGGMGGMGSFMGGR